jgi:hypothetical protein
MERLLFGAMPEGRDCGACVTCCRDLLINDPELKKPAFTLCQHCTGSGCGIYETRPSVCRSWNCVWRELGALPDALRPDRCGVMFDLDRVRPPGHVFEELFISAITDDAANLDRPEVRQALDMFVQQGQLPVWLSVGGDRRRLLYPSGPVVDAILDRSEERPVADAALAEAADRWLAAFRPFADLLAKHEAENPPWGLA